MKESKLDLEGPQIVEEYPCLEYGAFIDRGPGKPVMFGTPLASYILGSKSRISIQAWGESRSRTMPLKKAPKGFKILGEIHF